MLYNKNNKTDYYIFYFIMVLFFMFLLLQYRNVFMYFDDYGYVTLSYAVQVPGIEGTNYSLAQLFEFLKLHYNGWGGRVFAYFLEIILLKNGLWIMRLFMSFVVCGLFYIIHYYVLKSSGKKIPLAYSGILACSLFGFIQIDVLRDSFFWFIAAMVYLVPTILFLIGFIFYIKINIKEKSRANTAYKLISFLSFLLLSSSQEQLGGALIVTFIFILLLKKLYFKIRIEKFDIITLLGICGAFCFLVFSPGNRLRLSVTETSNGGEISFLDKLLLNFEGVAKLFFSDSFYLFLILVLITTLVISICLIKRKWGLKCVNYFYCTLNIVIFILVLKTNGNLYSLTENTTHTIILNITLILFVLLTFIQIETYYILEKKFIIVISFMFGFITVGALIVSPTLTLRSFAPFMLIYFIVALDVFVEIVYHIRRKKIQVGFIGVIVAISIFSLFPVYNGYGINSQVLKYNEQILLEAKEKEKTNFRIDSIILCKLKDDLYGYVMPYYYDNGVSSAMKIYYSLPESVSFEWIDPDLILIN